MKSVIFLFLIKIESTAVQQKADS